MIKKSDFNFELPEANIAKFPLGNRDKSKILIHQNGDSQYDVFENIGKYIAPDTLLVLNNAKVIPARLYFKRESGATIEVLLLEPVLPASYEESFNATASCTWKCIIGNSKKWKDDESIFLAENPSVISARLINRADRIVELNWDDGSSFSSLLDTIGELPLPPYLNRKTAESDYQTYQTVFAKNAGSVAAPTAGLHFTDIVFEGLIEKGIRSTEVTLHVGAGTFLPVKADNVEDHEMHRENFEISKDAIKALLQNTKRITIGTTSLRVLESLYWLGVQLREGNESLLVMKMEPYEIESTLTYEDSLSEILKYMENLKIYILFASTEIMILPHYKPKSIIGLITNFHLPKSTLLMLVSSVVGETWREMYKDALAHEFRFLSYGDSSLLYL